MSAELKAFLTKFDLERYLCKFEENEVRLDELKLLNDDDVNQFVDELTQNMGKLRRIIEKRKIIKSIKSLQNNEDTMDVKFFNNGINIENIEINASNQNMNDDTNDDWGNNFGTDQTVQNETDKINNNDNIKHNDTNESEHSNENDSDYNPNSDIEVSKSDDKMMNITKTKKKNKKKCKICNKYIGKQRMAQHIFQVHGDKPYECRYCNYKAVRSDYVLKHERTHTGIKLFKCNYCDHESAYRSSITAHERRHLSIKPFKCKHCNFRSKYKSSISKHKKNCKKRPQ